MTRATRNPIYKSKGQRSRSSGRLTPWPKISRTFRTGRPTNFRLGIRMEYDDLHHRHARWPTSWKLWMAVQVTTCRGRGPNSLRRLCCKTNNGFLFCHKSVL